MISQKNLVVIPPNHQLEHVLQVADNGNMAICRDLLSINFPM